MKVFADDKTNATPKLKFVMGWLENIVEKEENAGYQHFLLLWPHPGSSVVSLWDSWPGGCEFDPWLRRLSGMFSPLTSAEACEKRSLWVWKEKLC